MYRPRLGVSLHDISTEINDELLEALAASRIATLEVMARLFEDGDRSSRGAARCAPTLLTEGIGRAGIQPMTVHALFGSAYDFSVLDRESRQRALAATSFSLQVAVELGAPMLVVHASAEPVSPQERDIRLELARGALAEIGERCHRAGKRVAVELLPRTCLGNTVEELLALLGGLDAGTFGVCLDTNHLMGRHAELANVVRQLGDRLMTLHLSDYDGVDEKHALPGQGVLDWRSFLEALDDIGYGGPFNYECHLDGETPGERIAALEENFQWLTKLLTE